MLQGSLENFALDEVLGLLSSTNKTGQLEISGDRGTGSLMFNDGRLVDGSASHTANGTDVEDVMFELLRYGDGTFTFTNRDIEPGDNAQNVVTILSEAESRLTDWRQIEAVVPTLDHHVAPAQELPDDEVTISRNEWAVLTVIAAGCPASVVCDRLEYGEVEGSRQIKNLAERQLVLVTEPVGGFNAVSRGTGGALAARSSDPLAQAATTAEVPAGLEVPSALNPEPATADPANAAPGEPEGDLLSSLEDDSLSDGILSIGAMADGMGPNGLSIDSANEADGNPDRPPMPPIPTPDELMDNGPAGVPPAPPSPSEISNFSDGLDDLSSLVEDEESKGGGGLLARYRKNDD